MAAEELYLSDNIDAEFNPKVAILCNDSIRFEAYAEHLWKNNYPCQVYNSPDDNVFNSPEPGTIFFISFNLKSGDAVALSKRLEQAHHMTCIVFAEVQGVDTAAKLSSAKLTQTLQHPYTEKNFLMAVHTVVKKRKAQHEKNLRKQNFLERQKQLKDRSTNQTRLNLSTDQTFKSESLNDANDSLIIQKAAEKVIDDQARVFKGEEPADNSVLYQSGQSNNKLFAIQKGEPNESMMTLVHGENEAKGVHIKGTEAESHFLHVKGAAPLEQKRKPIEPATRGEGQGLQSTDVSFGREAAMETQASPGTEQAAIEPQTSLVTKQATVATQISPGTEQASHEQSDQETMETLARLPISNYLPDTSGLWAILLLSILGILICAYCIYEIIWGNGFSY